MLGLVIIGVIWVIIDLEGIKNKICCNELLRLFQRLCKKGKMIEFPNVMDPCNL